MGIMITAVCPDLFQRTALANFSIAGDVEMVTDVTEAAVANVIGGNLRSSGPRPEAWPNNE